MWQSINCASANNLSGLKVFLLAHKCGWLLTVGPLSEGFLYCFTQLLLCSSVYFLCTPWITCPNRCYVDPNARHVPSHLWFGPTREMIINSHTCMNKSFISNSSRNQVQMCALIDLVSGNQLRFHRALTKKMKPTMRLPSGPRMFHCHVPETIILLSELFAICKLHLRCSDTKELLLLSPF